MRRKQWKTCLMAALLLILSGCFFQATDDLYSLPRPPKDYENLYQKIEEVLRTGTAEYAAPLQGTNTQPIQLVDLDGDGIQEAVVFFRILGGEQQMQIYLYHQMEDETYEVQSIIKGDGNAIYTVSYENLDDEPDKELVVSWQISSLVYNLGAYGYSIQEQEYVELMFTSYNRYALLDIDKDNQKEILVLNVNSIQGENKADLFDFDAGTKSMILRDTASMSREITSISSTRVGYIKDGGVSAPALFVTSDLTNGISTISDVFAWREGRLVNITLNAESGMSESTRRVNSTISIRDIDEDGLLELPQPVLLPLYPKDGADSFWAVLWQQYDIHGTPIRVFNTYYNDTDGWYLVLPDAWEGKITLTRSNVVSGERAITFHYWESQDPNIRPQEFLTIYKLTGPNRETRSRMGTRFVLLEEGDSTIYAAEFEEGAWDYGLDQEGLMKLFHLISSDWPTES